MDYDPLISKLVAWGTTRQEAMDRMRRALDEYSIGGIKSNLGLFRSILRYSDFLDGKLDTGLLDRLLSAQPRTQVGGPGASGEVESDRLKAVALAAALAEVSSHSTLQVEAGNHGPASRWKLEGRRALLRPHTEE